MCFLPYDVTWTVAVQLESKSVDKKVKKKEIHLLTYQKKNRI